MRLKGGGDDRVLSRRQAEPLGHLSQVDVGLTLGFGRRVEEEVLVQMLVLSAHLKRKKAALLKKNYTERILYYCIVDFKKWRNRLDCEETVLCYFFDVSRTSFGTWGEKKNKLEILSLVFYLLLGL